MARVRSGLPEGQALTDDLALDTLRFELDADELAGAYVRHSTSVRNSVLRSRLLGIVCLVLTPLYFRVSPAAAIAPLVVSAIALLGTVPALLRRRTATGLRHVETLLEPVEITAADDGLHTVTTSSRAWFGWRQYGGIIDSDDGVAVLLRGGGSVRWIPARAFCDRDAQRAWCEQCTRWMANS